MDKIDFNDLPSVEEIKDCLDKGTKTIDKCRLALKLLMRLHQYHPSIFEEIYSKEEIDELLKTR